MRNGRPSARWLGRSVDPRYRGQHHGAAGQQQQRHPRGVRRTREPQRAPPDVQRRCRGIGGGEQESELQQDPVPDVVMNVVRHLVREDHLDLVVCVLGQQGIGEQDAALPPTCQCGFARRVFYIDPVETTRTGIPARVDRSRGARSGRSSRGLNCRKAAAGGRRDLREATWPMSGCRGGQPHTPGSMHQRETRAPRRAQRRVSANLQVIADQSPGMGRARNAVQRKRAIERGGSVTSRQRDEHHDVTAA